MEKRPKIRLDEAIVPDFSQYRFSPRCSDLNKGSYQMIGFFFFICHELPAIIFASCKLQITT